MRTRSFVASILAVGLLGCGAQEQADTSGEGSEEPAATPSPEQPVSILRPEVEQPGLEQEVLAALQITIGFPEGGAEFDSAALEALESILQSDQLALGGSIILRGHSDSAGSDRVNLDAAEARALSVAEWLIENGVNPDRIDVIVFGEQNPAAPNALADGSPNETGRAANRRVEIEIPTVSVADAE